MCVWVASACCTSYLIHYAERKTRRGNILEDFTSTVWFIYIRRSTDAFSCEWISWRSLTVELCGWRLFWVQELLCLLCDQRLGSVEAGDGGFRYGESGWGIPPEHVSCTETHNRRCSRTLHQWKSLFLSLKDDQTVQRHMCRYFVSSQSILRQREAVNPHKKMWKRAQFRHFNLFWWLLLFLFTYYLLRHQSDNLSSSASYFCSSLWIFITFSTLHLRSHPYPKLSGEFNGV